MSELLVEAKNSEGVFKGRGNLDFSWEISVNIRYLLLESIYVNWTNICNALLQIGRLVYNTNALGFLT